MLFLRSSKIIFIAFFILGIGAKSFSQKYLFSFGESLDNEDNILYLGIGIGSLATNLSIWKNESFLQSDSILSVNPTYSFGISINSIAMYRISEHILIKSSVLPLPCFKIMSFAMEYTTKYPNQETKIYNIPSTRLSYPLEIVLHSDRINNGNFFVSFGGFYSFDVASDERTTVDKIFKLKRVDYGLSLALGINFFGKNNLNQFEIKYSFGMSNVFIREENFLLSNVIDRLQTQQLTISINLLGGLFKK